MDLVDKTFILTIGTNEKEIIQMIYPKLNKDGHIGYQNRISRICIYRLSHQIEIDIKLTDVLQICRI